MNCSEKVLDQNCERTLLEPEPPERSKWYLMGKPRLFTEHSCIALRTATEQSVRATCEPT